MPNNTPSGAKKHREIPNQKVIFFFFRLASSNLSDSLAPFTRTKPGYFKPD